MVSVHTDGTVNTPQKRYLDFNPENGAQEATIVSRGNQITYELNNVITVSNWSELQSLFAVGNISDYSYIRLEGAMFFNRYAGSDGVTVSRVHMNEAATGETTIYLDCSSYVNSVYRTAFGVNVMDSNETPSTAKFADYCAQGGMDVMGYWVNADNTTDAQLSKVVSMANSLVGSSFANPMDFVQQAYTSAVGSCTLGERTAKEVLQMPMDKTNDTSCPDTELSGAVVPNLYGGLDIKDGFVTDVNRTRLVQESYMTLGDVIVTEYDGIYEVFIYLGDGQLAKVSSTDGICILVTSTGEAYSGTNVFATFIAYDQYVILRPSMLG